VVSGGHAVVARGETRAFEITGSIGIFPRCHYDTMHGGRSQWSGALACYVRLFVLLGRPH
jgi:hypothetical protein